MVSLFPCITRVKVAASPNRRTLSFFLLILFDWSWPSESKLFKVRKSDIRKKKSLPDLREISKNQIIEKGLLKNVCKILLLLAQHIFAWCAHFKIVKSIWKDISERTERTGNFKYSGKRLIITGVSALIFSFKWIALI